jgi:hypothetical protein
VIVEEEDFTGLNPWHAAVCAGRGLSCHRCHYYYQGKEEWRRDFLVADPHRWYVLIATSAREEGWKMTKRGRLYCPRCVRKRKRRK